MMPFLKSVLFLALGVVRGLQFAVRVDRGFLQLNAFPTVAAVDQHLFMGRDAFLVLVHGGRMLVQGGFVRVEGLLLLLEFRSSLLVFMSPSVGILSPDADCQTTKTCPYTTLSIATPTASEDSRLNATLIHHGVG